MIENSTVCNKYLSNLKKAQLNIERNNKKLIIDLPIKWTVLIEIKIKLIVKIEKNISKIKIKFLDKLNL